MVVEMSTYRFHGHSMTDPGKTYRDRAEVAAMREKHDPNDFVKHLLLEHTDATEDELWAALETAQARTFVEAMPEGLDTPISQGGTTVSGGQRQRLAIARALVRRPAIYLFDDAFSALDLATEARLRQALEPLTREAAVLVVAQRISSIVDADRIVVLDDGRIVGHGRHEELQQECGTYQEIVRSQFAAGEVA